MRQIFPVCDEIGQVEQVRPAGQVTMAKAGADQVIARLGELYGCPAGTWVRANMVTSVDGAIAIAGRSGGLSGAADRLVFTVLRSLADVIVVGAGTARAERYGLVRRASIWPQFRAGRPATPAIAVVTANLSLDLDSELIRGDGTSQTILLIAGQAPADRVAQAAATTRVIIIGEDQVPAPAAIQALTGLGYHQILVEGGPRLLGGLAAADLLDELCVTMSPLLEGGHAPGRMLSAARPVAGNGLTALRLASVLEDDGFLLSRYCRARPDGSDAQ